MECWNSFGVWSEDKLREFGRERTQTQQGTSEGHLILINVRINRVLQQRRRIRQIPGTSPVLHLLLSMFLRTKEKAPTDIFKVPHFFFFCPFSFCFPYLISQHTPCGTLVHFFPFLYCLFPISALLYLLLHLLSFPILFPFLSFFVKFSLSFLFNLYLFPVFWHFIFLHHEDIDWRWPQIQLLSTPNPLFIPFLHP